MSLTNDIATAIAAKCANATGRDTSPVETDTIPFSPYCIVGAHTGTLTPGSWEDIRYAFPIKVFVERTADNARTSTAVNDLVDAFIAEFRAGIKLGNLVSQIIIASWNTDLFATVGNAEYWVVELSVQVTVAQGQTYSA